MDQAKLDEMAQTLGGWDMLEGSVGVLPLVHDTRPGTEAFVAKFRKAYNRDPGSEASYHYSTLNAVAEAMKLAGTRLRPEGDPCQARARPIAKLPPERNPARITGVDERGGSNAKIVVGVVKNGKVVTVDAASVGQ